MISVTDLSPEFAEMQKVSRHLDALHAFANCGQANSAEAQMELQAFLATLSSYLQECANLVSKDSNAANIL